MDKICYIIGAGDVPENVDFFARDCDFVICADGGFRYRSLLKKDCDLVVGDFDSLLNEPDFKNKVVLPCEKDFTDMKEAVDEGLKRGYRNFVLLGAWGGERIDHSIGNLQLLNYTCGKGARCTILHENTVMTAFSDGELTFDSNMKGYVSVVSLCDESKGVTIEGLKYEVKNVSLYSDIPLGISNEFVGKKSRVSVVDGKLLVIYNKIKNN